MPIITMHGDCVACLGKAQGVNVDDQTVVVLALIASGSNPIGAILLDMCPIHQRETKTMVEELRAAWNAGTD